MQDPYAATAEPTVASAPPAPTDFTASPTNRQGTYSMWNTSGKMSKVPYSQIEDASKAGWKMDQSDRLRYLKDAAYDPSLKDISAPQGSKVVGKNTAGQPILAPDDANSPGLLRRGYQALTTWQEPGMYTPKGLEGSTLASGIDQQLTAIHNVSGRAIQGAGSTVRHPIDSLIGLGSMVKELGWNVWTDHPHGPLEDRIEEFKKDYAVNPTKAMENAAGDVLAIFATHKLMGVAGDVAKTAVQSVPPVARAASAVKGYVTETVPGRMVSNLIRPSAADMKFGKEPAKAILDEGITGNNLYELGDKVFTAIHKVGHEIDQQAALNPNAVVDVTSALKPIDDAILKAQTHFEPDLYKRLVALREQLTHDAQVGPNGNLIRGNPRNLNMSPVEALKYKRMIGDKVRWTGNDPYENEVNEAAINAYGRVKVELNNALKNTDFARLNERYSNLVGAAKAIERRIPVAERNAHWSLSDITLGATGHVDLMLLRKLISWPPVATRIAQNLYRMRNAQAPPLVGSIGRKLPYGGQAAGATRRREQEQERNAALLDPAAEVSDPYAATAEPRPVASGPALEPATQSFVDAAVGGDANLAALTRAIILAEGSGPAAVSPKGAMGRMQLMPGTAKDMGVDDPFDEEQNIQGGVKYLKQLLDRYHGDIRLTAAAYNAGPKAVDDSHGVPNYKQTQDYVANVMRYMEPASTEEASEEESVPEEDSPDQPPEQPAAAPLPVNKAEAEQRKPAAQPVSVMAPDGNEYVFQNQQAADKFKAAAGMR